MTTILTSSHTKSSHSIHQSYFRLLHITAGRLTRYAKTNLLAVQLTYLGAMCLWAKKRRATHHAPRPPAVNTRNRQITPSCKSSLQHRHQPIYSATQDPVR